MSFWNQYRYLSFKKDTRHRNVKYRPLATADRIESVGLPRGIILVCQLGQNVDEVIVEIRELQYIYMYRTFVLRMKKTQFPFI